MWILFHFLFLYVCDVSPLFHIIAVFVAMLMSQIHIRNYPRRILFQVYALSHCTLGFI